MSFEAAKCFCLDDVGLQIGPLFSGSYEKRASSNRRLTTLSAQQRKLTSVDSETEFYKFCRKILSSFAPHTLECQKGNFERYSLRTMHATSGNSSTVPRHARAPRLRT